MQKADVLSVLISSPSDVAEFRATVRDTLVDWSLRHGLQGGRFLAPVMWEKDTAPEMSGHPQQIIDRQIVDRCDMAVAIFGTRLGGGGTPETSGTVSEIERMLKAGKLVSVYFSHKDTNPWDLNSDDFRAVRDYYDANKSKGLFFQFKTTNELRELLQNHLSIHFAEVAEPEREEVAAAPEAESAPKSDVEAETARIHPWIEAVSILRNGDYQRGMEKLRETPPEGDPPSEALISIARLIAYEDATSIEAFNDLRAQAEQHPRDTTVRHSFASALRRSGRASEARKEMEYAVQVATEDADMLLALDSLTAYMLEDDLVDDAISQWQGSFSATESPARRAGIARQFARFMSGPSAMNIPLATGLSEFAMRLEPNNDDERFSLGYSYIEKHKVPILGMRHFTELVRRHSDHSNALHNLGLTLDNLQLPILSVEKYERAVETGGALAAFNLGYKLLGAGFERLAGLRAQEAKNLYTGDGDEEAQPERLQVAIVDRRKEEKKRLEGMEATATNVIDIRVRAAKALLDTSLTVRGSTFLAREALQQVELAVDDTGSLTGTLTGLAGKRSLFGKAVGRCLWFRWFEEKPPTDPNKGLALASMLANTRSSGFGYLVIGDKHIEGFTAEGEEAIDPLLFQHLREWKLLRDN